MNVYHRHVKTEVLVLIQKTAMLVIVQMVILGQHFVQPRQLHYRLQVNFIIRFKILYQRYKNINLNLIRLEFKYLELTFLISIFVLVVFSFEQFKMYTIVSYLYRKNILNFNSISFFKLHQCTKILIYLKKILETNYLRI